MSVINDDYLYHEYCTAPLPPPMAHGRARELASRLGVPEKTDICTGLHERVCRVSVEDGDRMCPGAQDLDNVVVRCGNAVSCRSAGDLVREWKAKPDAQERFSPKHRELVRQTFKWRGTPKARSKLTCVERRGNAELCEENSLCFVEDAAGPAFLQRLNDCKAYAPTECVPGISRALLLDAVLRMHTASLSGNFRRRLERNIDAMADKEVCQALQGFYPPKKAVTAQGLIKQVNGLAQLVLGESNMLDAETLQAWAEEADVDLKAKTAGLLAAAFNVASAGLSLKAPWWFYFSMYPSGRAAFQDILSDRAAGHILKLTLLLTGMKGNIFFNDIEGLLDKIPLGNSTYNGYASIAASALLSVLGSKLKNKSK
jgi:hypothetical protein